MPIGSAILLTKSGISPNSEKNIPAYLKNPIRIRSITTDTATHSFAAFSVSEYSTLSAQNHEHKAMNMSRST